ncbi:hypothetical protein FP2506_14964 [Fulvimarina pelagi HTCC2506]|uniref:Uncharacterized protein n=1 Tax=Fulvimarina pelagi HTCC2506 TaxID=314231 RepID=Q0G3T7_9HYPH|nr:hypothetical protein FP2506_14964 [Fulvimarina pelagi HTCC2506]
MGYAARTAAAQGKADARHRPRQAPAGPTVITVGSTESSFCAAAFT